MIDELKKKDFDVIIVGAGPAGCSAAYFLSTQGYSVLLLDKASFPRDKICGDGIGSHSLSLLEKIGALEKIESIKPHKTSFVSVSAPNSQIMKGKIPSVNGLRDFGYIIPRMKFDFLLFDYIRSSTETTVLENFSVTDLLYDGEHACGVRGLYNNSTEELTAKCIIGADGANSIVARKLSLYNGAPKHRAIAVRAYFENVEGLDDSFGIHYDEAVVPGYGWIFPTGESSANVGVGIFNKHKDSKRVKELFEIFIEKNKFAQAKLKNAVMVEKSFKGFPLTCGSFPSKRNAANVLLIGDAGSFIDPLTGEGIYYALKSGELSTIAIMTGLSNKNKFNSIGDLYENLWRKDFRWKDFIPGYILQSFLSKNAIVNLSINRAAKKEKNAATMAGVICHVVAKKKMFFNL
ncbi:MAG: geranylgeranyl reductase family protein [bacterium]|nr:geranylgeranyl reductase family protein [bacterium]